MDFDSAGDTYFFDDFICTDEEPYLCSRPCPTPTPTKNPTRNPSKIPTENPTQLPTQNPTKTPTRIPTQNPTTNPSENPSKIPTENPTERPSRAETPQPTIQPINDALTTPTSSDLEESEQEADILNLLPGMVGAVFCFILLALAMSCILVKRAEIRGLQKKMNILESAQPIREYGNFEQVNGMQNVRPVPFHMTHNLF